MTVSLPNAPAPVSLFPEITPVDRLSDDFAAWWEKYPRKRCKDDALRAYKAARKQHAHEALVHARDALIAEKREPQFWPYPATFLRRHLEDYIGSSTKPAEKSRPSCPDHGPGSACLWMSGAGWVCET